MGNRFNELVERIPEIGLEHHRETILENSRANLQYIRQSIRDVIKAPFPCLVISAGPSLYRENILPRINGFRGTVVATDGAYIQCLKAGIVPDYVVTIDPHPTRIVRWFGDPDYERNLNGDDYFARQDLDVAFRTNSIKENENNLSLVDAQATPLVVATSAPANLVARTSHCSRYWFVPLVDDPLQADSITAEMVRSTACPALNTGGTVGTSAWVFAHEVLRASRIAVVGMDFGYYLDTPLEKTQSWHMLGGDPEMYPKMLGHWGEHFTDPTYAWYRQNFLDLLAASGGHITNCSEAGLLYGARVDCRSLDEWLASCS